MSAEFTGESYDRVIERALDAFENLARAMRMTPAQVLFSPHHSQRVQDESLERVFGKGVLVPDRANNDLWEAIVRKHVTLESGKGQLSSKEAKDQIVRELTARIVADLTAEQRKDAFVNIDFVREWIARNDPQWHFLFEPITWELKRMLNDLKRAGLEQ